MSKYLQKVISKTGRRKIIFCWHLDSHSRKEQDPDADLDPNADLDPDADADPDP
jgi:hypothetical protein